MEILEFVDELSPQVFSRVEGNGEGIALEQREKIFKPFEQADSWHKGGVGLELKAS